MTHATCENFDQNLASLGELKRHIAEYKRVVWFLEHDGLVGLGKIRCHVKAVGVDD